MKPLSHSTLESLEKLTSEAEANLDQVIEYLEGRGIVRYAAIAHRLGYVSDPSSKYYGFLSIPSLGINLAGEQEVRGIKYRNLGVEGSKYLCTDGFGSRLFNPEALMRLDTDTIHVTEGELDCIILSQLGYAAVAVPGATQWKDERAEIWSLMLEGYRRVFVWGDEDDAGREFTKAVTSSLPNATGVSIGLGDKSDVTDAYLLGGAELIEELIKNA